MAPGAFNSKQADVERIVRQVLAELAGRDAGTAVPASSDLVVTGRVVSLADLEGRLSGVTRVVVERGAVFTPAARDELNGRGVTVASAVRGNEPTTANDTISLGCVETKYDAEPLVAAVTKDGIRVERITETDLSAMVDTLCERAMNRGFGLLITGLAAAAVCLANRQTGVRAAAANDVATLEQRRGGGWPKPAGNRSGR